MVIGNISKKENNEITSETLFGKREILKLPIDKKGRPIVEVEPDPEEVYEYYQKQGWIDGMPIIPPTERRVKKMLRFTDRDPEDLVGMIPPLQGVATVEKIAINAVAAGCLPQYLPVLITCMEAALDPKCNIRVGISTASPHWPVFIINGPVRNEIGIPKSWGIIGSGFRSNTTIARAVTLCFSSIGGSRPGVTEGKLHGALGRYGTLFGEYEEASPWEPLHVEKGFDAEISTVTCFPDMKAPYRIYTHAWGQPTTELYLWARGLAHYTNYSTFGDQGSNPLLMINPASAKEFSEDGWTKDDIKHFLYENARVHRDDQCQRNPALPEYVHKAHIDKSLFAPHRGRRAPRWVRAQVLEPDNVIYNKLICPIVADPEDFWIVVAGQEDTIGGKLFYWGPMMHGEEASIKPITRKDGTPVKSIDELTQA